MVVERAGNGAREQIQIDAALFALPTRSAVRRVAFDLLAEVCDEVAQAQHGIEAPLVGFEETFLGTGTERRAGL